MKPLYLACASAMALTAAACGPKVPAARAALECPMKQGDLTRTSASSDGKTCTYAAEGGAEVTLQLVSTQGGVDSTLAAIETNLLANRLTPEQQAAAGAATGAAAGGSAASAAAADAAAKQAAADTKGLDLDLKVDGKAVDAVNVEMKNGKTVVTEGEGSTTRIDLPGIHIVANDSDDTANIRVGPVNIDADEDTATIRVRRDVRLRGEALNPEKRGLRATFIYTGGDLPDGYRFVGYEAGGPKRGPLTVAVVRSKSGGPDGEDLYPDVKKLVRKNGGV
ncbi:MAG: hypothetical protein A2790_17260 [Phenylobacterium sp. RIFCSPHIGHO2_01_FULL_69_31]|uniref:hypothetical protein n=1 Tax=Phenylobacterium sp. RIFCSPHIGHO2_01_FULL_69_31 TaxID=1801944 RepID=UPI0008D6C5EF|nr:hypothetical protein [Phenylobacterium sp. RIFCSPHIGHO2_01_FULL_69_31]OHB30359.1 MAG: hypothetical protein A2790_17260 [Phenylobacterium sp. RIFCSPHIGHO2_01_FULL_69_31]